MKRSSCVVPLLILAFGVGSTTATAQEAPRLDVATMSRPIEALDNVWIEELTMMEVRDALAEGKTTALILTGGIEQNGPYLTTGKHNHVLRVMGEAIARRLGDALIAPIVTLEPGNPENIRSPGTVVLSRATYEAMLTDMATSLKSQGFRNIILMGDSGGNLRSMTAVADALSTSWKGGSTGIYHIADYYNYDDVHAYQRDVLGVDEDPRLEGLHDDYYITSIIMNDDPRHVRLEQRVKAGKASINGISIVPAEKTIEHGRRLTHRHLSRQRCRVLTSMAPLGYPVPHRNVASVGVMNLNDSAISDGIVSRKVSSKSWLSVTAEGKSLRNPVLLSHCGRRICMAS